MVPGLNNMKIGIVGLGLIGGSLAKALKERLGVKDITAVNSTMGPLEQALEDGAICRGFCELNGFVYDCDIIFLCTPVKFTAQYIEALRGKVKPRCIITDVGSTKGSIINFLNEMELPPRFIGGHPMTGSEKTGYMAGMPHLFENAYYILTPCKSTDEDAVTIMSEIIKGLGGLPVVLDAEDHDTITAVISHVPHIIASSLVNLVKAIDSSHGKIPMLAAGGFKDITRIASSSPEMWESIVLSNKEHIRQVLEAYAEQINLFKEKVVSEDSQWLLDSFGSAKIYRDSLPNSKKGLIGASHEIIVDVVDRPGIIGNIAMLLGNSSINIKNINVSNSREFEQGCLRITLPDAESVNIAFDLLASNGYKVYRN